jgi:hypothetical protein
MANLREVKMAIIKPVVESPSATETRAGVAAVVSDGQVANADAALATFDAQNGTDFAFGWTAWQPGWNGFDEPAPTPMAWRIHRNCTLAEAAKFKQAMQALSGIGVRYYDSLTAEEYLTPANTVDSIYADGYDTELPVLDGFAAMAAWLLEVGGQLPPREEFGA